MLFTSFRNPYMPFIKYVTSDLVYIDPNLDCSCKGNSKVISQFMGRAKDITCTQTKIIITTGDI